MSNNPYNNQQHRQGPPRGYNPNAPSFIPNANAQAFIPGQPYGAPPPQMYYNQHGQPGVYYPQHPPNPMAYMQQQTAQMNIGTWQPTGPPAVVQQQNPVQSQPPPQAAPAPVPAEPVESWEDETPAPAAVSKPKPAPAPAPAKTEPPKKAEPAPAPKVEKPKPAKEEATPVEEVVRPKLPPVNVEDIEKNRKEHLNVVFIGHVDAGKSTICGQLMFLTGMVDKRTLEKYERDAKEMGRESWYLSWAMDTNDEERAKGKTVEVGRAFFETEKKHFTILDAPGHKSFVPNMISGASQADLAVLVISARKGEFETGFERGGQTREHAMLVKTAGVKHLVILVNKMDDSTVNWEEERYNEIQQKLSPYLRKCGFNPKTDITYIPCAGLTGAFLKERPSGVASWYDGQCFLDFLDNLAKVSRDYGGPVRMLVCDKYSDMGTMVIGKMESGVITKGQSLTIMPNRTVVQVLQTLCDDEEVEQVVAGDNVKLKLKGVEESDILSGFVICSPEAPCKVGKVFDAEVVILEHKSIITSGYTCVLHLQSAVEEVSVKQIICKINKKTGEKERAKFVKQDEKCFMRLESSEAFCLDTFKEFAVMGRFTLRDEGKTIGIGKVVKVIE
uniref:Tr-type G domain-containing protein n=1 Tax=Panagrellus redivivus TaxID=6233 RepID=A0A7E4ZV82_PANRE